MDLSFIGKVFFLSIDILLSIDTLSCGKDIFRTSRFVFEKLGLNSYENCVFYLDFCIMV